MGEKVSKIEVTWCASTAGGGVCQPPSARTRIMTKLVVVKPKALIGGVIGVWGAAVGQKD